MERERYDGADVAHIILGTGSLDWRRLLTGSARIGGCCWRIWCCSASSSPAPAPACPPGSCDELMGRLAAEVDAPDAEDPVCYGTLLSWSQYLGDVLGGSFRDAPDPPLRLDECGGSGARGRRRTSARATPHGH